MDTTYMTQSEITNEQVPDTCSHCGNITHAIVQYDGMALCEDCHLDYLEGEYEVLTDCNEHGEAALLLAEAFGTTEEAKLIKNLNQVAEYRGYAHEEEIELRNQIANKYYKRLKK